MTKNMLDCVINIYHDEILDIVPLIGNICDLAEVKLNIVKFNITNKYDKYRNTANVNNITSICTRYKSLSNMANSIAKIKMPEFADIYFTTEYLPSHTLKRQYSKYVLIYYDTKQLYWTDKTKKEVEGNNIRYFFQFDAIIILKETEPTLRESILKYYPDVYKDKINDYFDKYSFVPNRMCMEHIKLIEPNKNIFDRIYSFGLWIDARYMHKNGITNNLSFSGDGSYDGISDTIIETLSKFIADYNITQIIDLSCGDMKWMSVVLDKNKQITDYHGNDVSLTVIRMAQKNIKKRDNLNISFSNCNTSHKRFAKNLSKIIKGTSLIFSRLTIQHMTNEEIINTFRNLIKYVKFSYFGISSIKSLINIHDEWIVLDDTNGQDINRGGYRGVDLDLPPYDIVQPVAILDDQVHKSSKVHKELLVIYYYTYNEFIKLKKIKKKFIKHEFQSYMSGGAVEIPKNKYKIYKMNKIDELLNKTDNIESTNDIRIWYTIKK
jgi:hypothetical protein